MRQPFWWLWVDIAKFFPSIHFDCRAIAEALHGLPGDAVHVRGSLIADSLTRHTFLCRLCACPAGWTGYGLRSLAFDTGGHTGGHDGVRLVWGPYTGPTGPTGAPLWQQKLYVPEEEATTGLQRDGRNALGDGA